MAKVKSIIRHWLPIATLAVAMCGLVYLAVQQELRMSANDPQIQLSEDAATALAKGDPVESVLPAGTVDVGKSLAPFVMVFNEKGETLASSGLLHGQAPGLPAGVLDYVRSYGEDRITWQPEPGVRIAAVINRYEGATKGFVLAGRSLWEVEKREDQALMEAGLALVAALAATLVVTVIVELLLPTPRP